MKDMSQAKTNISNNDFSSSQAKRVKVVTRLKDFSGRRRPVSLHMLTVVLCARVAELGRLSSGAKMAMKIFAKRVFTIFASNASFLRVIANLHN